MESVTAFVGTLLGGGVLGGCVATITQYLLNRNKQQGELCLAEDAQTNKHYGELVSRLEARITKVETDHQKCMDEHITAARQQGILEGQVSELRDIVKAMTRPAAA